MKPHICFEKGRWVIKQKGFAVAGGDLIAAWRVFNSLKRGKWRRLNG